MEIYLVHATSFDYQQLLYAPLKTSELYNFHHFIFPHDHSNEPINSKQLIQNADLIIAEVSYPSTGSGIELGWANDAGVPIFCIHKINKKPSSVLQFITTHIQTYSNTEELIKTLETFLQAYQIAAV